MALRSDNHGVSAIVSALLRFIHPSEHICNKFPNVVQGQQLENCVTIRQEVKKVSQKEQLVLVVHHEDFKNPDDSYIELHGMKRYWKVSQEGHPDYFFDAIAPTDENANSHDESLMPEAVSEHINGNSCTTEMIQALHDEVDVDDDNKPTPENKPQSTDPTSSPLNTEWGHSGFCYNSTTNLLTTLEKQWGHCYISQNLCGAVAESLFLTVAFVFSRQLLSYERKVCLQRP